MTVMTGLALDAHSDVPLYRQVFDQVVDRIKSGAFPSKFRLPPTRTLARELGTHRNTVVRAYEDLEASGFVTSRVGRGTFVTVPPPAAPTARQSSFRAPARASLPWAELTSHAALLEPQQRFERLATHKIASGAAPINLTRMQPSPELLPHDPLRRCLDHVLRSSGAKLLGYAPREGMARLREQITVDLARQRVPAYADDIVVTAGIQQGLDLVARALINPGDVVLVDESTYSGALSILWAAGARVVGIPADDEGPEMEALERAGRGAKALYLMPNHNNPTGRRISAARREALCAWSRRAGVPLIEDDYAADLNLDGHVLPPALRALDGEVVYLGSFSKRLVPALRVGFLVCPPGIRARLLGLKQTTDLGNSMVLQEALAEFLERGYLRAHLRRVLPEYRRRRDALEKALAAHLPKSLNWVCADVGMTGWLPLPPGFDPEEVYESAQRAGVLVTPSTVSGVDPRRHAGIRLSFAAEPLDRLAEGARRLGRALAGIAERQRRVKQARGDAAVIGVV
jgi:DNA-binding transcriptional MocR family regulator